MPSVYVRTLSSVAEASKTGSVKDLKNFLEETQGIPADEQRISYCGHIFEDDELLEELEDKITLDMTLDLEGGGKKRKKKTYTKPKKIKAKHKKVKLAVLKYYRVDQSGKVERLRNECTKQCGAGTFMSNHFNRHYCGKCHFTLMLVNPGRDPALDKKKDAPKEDAAAAAAAAAPAKGKKKK
ncbi:ubiquitin_small subunit ribosomal protein S27Ae fusion protein [Guillardia theta CCMP2712]|uniref:Ubiquitin_small subunit ribosomal protein S27Ae fusion protein n=1 Tax=Guillardia theta (strain CCMP2712) TaxID=905079 RepID=L1IRB4_GUITC|nr:ubiquitin_small subunit ribosomal protein S27Ae fusion protein [Guillardia theta CCMP2712]EKX38365.1 ubiquitin_small subunit ribosomal protein S27Ae fusion protein [Guillardia theta CCMP2712]|eukprot:XP_005825345.1 ubiquitin_small subunit ribosomal protein S27Ae fusion protein [Guillardia theta CCMP2712]